MPRLEYQLMAEHMTAADLEPFIPAGVKSCAESSTAEIVGFGQRQDALAVRGLILQNRPAARVRIYEQTMIEDEFGELTVSDDFLDRGRGKLRSRHRRHLRSEARGSFCRSEVKRSGDEF